MKFTDGYWLLRPGVRAQYAQQAHSVERIPATSETGEQLVIEAPTKVIAHRGDTLNRTLLTVTLSSPAEGVIRVRAQRHRDRTAGPHGFDLVGAEAGHGVAEVCGDGASLTSGPLVARVGTGEGWQLDFEAFGQALTSGGAKSIGHVSLEPDANVAAEPAGVTGVSDTGLAQPGSYLLGRLSLGVGELVYGLGERFGPLTKNGQSVDIWNADGGTSSEQAYKNVPFYLTNAGYGVLVNHPGHVSFEVGSESVQEVQFSVPGESLEYLVFAGPTPAEVLRRYTALVGRPALVPEWSYGTWLSTSFTTDYDEETVTSFIEEMEARDLPLSVFHFDCFWMREFHWTDFEWDPRMFPDPEGMLSRLRDRGLRVSAWINPYIAGRSRLFEEAAEAGYLVRRPDGSVWQWDMWQSGMGLVDFTHPGARAWFQDKVRGLLHQGVDAIKTDFGERVPTDVVWHDGSDPVTMHNWYTQLYNEAVFEVLEEVNGPGEAVLFARSATVGGQRMPVHWGGDNSSSFASMAESLRGGLSLSLSGFGFWSHDIGGFEGEPDPAVFKRWLAFGLLSSHSRLHGSGSYRVPWVFDTDGHAPGQSATEVARRFIRLKQELTPYLVRAGRTAHEEGVPVMRPMVLAFPDDPTCAHLDRQYMLGPDLLVAPVLSESGTVQYYLPAGTWTHLLTGEQLTLESGQWRTEKHDFDSLPAWVRAGSTLLADLTSWGGERTAAAP
ncbi:alpha-xylosidase [Salinactinospora qingdaonensis]|uniref:Alpha-xylosidase n=1 Tax=Salinactinospora qingdaonensis TaxID=702744 RepID=A0ABP7GEU2_9ACTN